MSFQVNYKTPMIIFQMVWLSLSFFLGILGNSFILYSTIRHKALKLDKMSVWIAKNLSVADMCNCVFILLPTLITQFKEGWMFGKIMCFIHYSFRFSFFAANIFLLNVLSFNKLMRCLFPLRNLSPSRKQRIAVTIATVIVGAIPTVWTLFLWSRAYLVLSEPSIYNVYAFGAYKICFTRLYGYRIPNPSIIGGINIALAVILFIVMCLSMTVMTVILLVYAVKTTNRPIVKKNICVVVGICTSFLITFLPACFCYIIRSYIYLDDLIMELSWSVGFLSVWINPVIHFVMNQNFREFTVNKLKTILEKI